MVLRQTSGSATIGQVLSQNMMICIITLLCIGLFMVMNATAPRGGGFDTSSMFFTKQLTWDILGIVCFVIIFAYIPVKSMKKAAPYLGVVSVLLLLGVLFVGKEINGAVRWYRIGSISFQPSEMTKIFSLLFFSWYLERNKNNLNKWWNMIVAMSLILLTVGLIALEPDLGNAALLFCVLVSMLYIAGAKLSHLMTLMFLTLPGFCFILYNKFDHVKRRLEVYMDPSEHLQDGFYQGHQALIALGSGGVSGKGAGMGLQKLYYLPEAHNDFIFAIIGEDFGFLGCSFVVLLYAVLVWFAIQALVKSTDLFTLLVSYGITFIFAGQALFNISVVTGVVPNKGISLPLISYGGSNALFTLIGLAVLVKFTSSLPPDRPKELGAIRLNKPPKVLF
ncbi:MAG: cell division protein FtsW [Planctomycetes bacterium]|nr:cell division protein FtsW [Planctomycetota bacterium]